jgi:hypothetical protein
MLSDIFDTNSLNELGTLTPHPWSRNSAYVGVTGQQRVFTPPRHLIPVSVCMGVCVSSFYSADLSFLLAFLNWSLFGILNIFPITPFMMKIPTGYILNILAHNRICGTLVTKTSITPFMKTSHPDTCIMWLSKIYVRFSGRFYRESRGPSIPLSALIYKKIFVTFKTSDLKWLKYYAISGIAPFFEFFKFRNFLIFKFPQSEEMFCFKVGD